MRKRFLFSLLLLASFPTFAQTVSDDLNLQLERLNTCELRVNNAWDGHQVVGLGDAGPIGGGLYGRSGNVFIASWGAILVICNKDVAYTLDIDQGMHYGLGPEGSKRALSNGQGQYMSYDIWTDYDKATEWMTGRGNVSDIADEKIEFEWGGQNPYGKYHQTPGDLYRVNLVPGDFYSDTNVVTMTYL